MNNEDKVKEIIADLLSVDLATVVPSANLMDNLKADSLDQVELVMSLEEAFDIEVSDEVAEKVHTVQDAIDCVCNLVKGRRYPQ